MKNYSKLRIKVLDRELEFEVITESDGFQFNEDGDYFSDEELARMNIPDDEVLALNKLVQSSYLQSDEFKNEVIAYINYGRNAIGMVELKEQDLWDDLSLSRIIIEKQKQEDAEDALKGGHYQLNILDMDSLEFIKISMLGEIEQTDEEHGISITFCRNKVARIGQHMDYSFYIT